ncbi:MAG: aminotransferase class I/II-fold pyridoxal phosphate-dependent enzyme [Verrucomicrobia bacterium]|nr:aminotransferase class I/II-fold pyridoxal phosphate-dependent enzyme [Verrucomicrobiota bacterium]
MGVAERELLLEALDSNWVAPLGPQVDAFEREFATWVGSGHAVALSSGTAALHLALRLLQVGEDDEVLVSSFTFAASANAVTYLGARPVFIDAESATWNMDPALLEEELKACAERGRLPRAVVVVDLYGQCANYGPILAACQRYEVPLIEDAAESLGATYRGKPAGTLGVIGVYSFNGNKIITTSGGGMLVSQRGDWVEKVRFWATQARDPAPHYEHSEIGNNYRMSNLLAAVGRGQLQVLEERVRQRRANNVFYREALGDLPGIGFMPVASYGDWNGWLTCITVDPTRFGCDREAIRRHLESLNIESRPLWKPMHLQPVFRDCRVRGGSVSAGLFECGLCLPSGSSLTSEERDLVVASIRSMRK